MPVDKVRLAIEQLAVQKGSKDRGIWRAEISVKDVLEMAGMVNSPGNQRYVVYLVNTWYPGSKVRPPQGDNGGFLDIRIRSV